MSFLQATFVIVSIGPSQEELYISVVTDPILAKVYIFRFVGHSSVSFGNKYFLEPMITKTRLKSKVLSFRRFLTFK